MMGQLRNKKAIAAIVSVCCLFLVVPAIVKAGGGDFQTRLKQKINAPKKIQYNLDAGQSGQFSYQSVMPSQQLDFEGQVMNESLGQERKDKMIAPAPAINQRLDAARRMPPPENPVLSSYAVYKTDYKAEIEDNVVTVKGNVLFEVFRKGWTQIPLVKSNVGLIDASINRGVSFVTMQGGMYYLMIDKPGRYTLDIEFLIKAQREREGGPGSFAFDLISAPISQFEFSMAETGVEIFIDPVIKLELKQEPKKTTAWAIMPNTNKISVRWTKALPKEEIKLVKLEPKVYVDTATYASIGEGLIRARTLLNYSILQSEISNLRIAMPDDVSVLDVQGKDLRDWKVSSKEGKQYLDAYLSFATKGTYTLTVTYERKIGEGTGVAQVPELTAMGVEREKGFFGLAAATSVELAANKTEQVSLIDVRELPPSIWSSGSSPILLAFKYLNHPFSISVDVTKHEELPVLVAAIDSAHYQTLVTEEGKSLTKAVFQMRNNVKQYVHLMMPYGSTLWSAFVAGKPVKPAKDKTGSILIPLEKSQLSGESLTQFPVEIVYLDEGAKMGFAGFLTFGLPQTDIPTSSLYWNVYLPQDYAYFNFGGDVKRLRGYKPSAIGGFLTRGLQGRLSSSDMVGEQFSPGAQTFYEEVKSDRMRGVLPIKIDIPEEGRLYRFSKLLVTEKDSPKVSVTFVKAFRPLVGFIKFGIFIAILVFVASFIRKIVGNKKQA